MSKYEVKISIETNVIKIELQTAHIYTLGPFIYIKNILGLAIDGCSLLHKTVLEQL